LPWDCEDYYTPQDARQPSFLRSSDVPDANTNMDVSYCINFN